MSKYCVEIVIPHKNVIRMYQEIFQIQKERKRLTQKDVKELLKYLRKTIRKSISAYYASQTVKYPGFLDIRLRDDDTDVITEDELYEYRDQMNRIRELFHTDSKFEIVLYDF